MADPEIMHDIHTCCACGISITVPPITGGGTLNMEPTPPVTPPPRPTVTFSSKEELLLAEDRLERLLRSAVDAWDPDKGDRYAFYAAFLADHGVTVAPFEGTR